jgi:hypothetical protein
MGFRFHPGIGNKKDPVNPVNPVKKEKDFESCLSRPEPVHSAT